MWLHAVHKLGARNDPHFASILPQVKTLLTVMQEFEGAGTRLACLLSGENPEDDDARGGFVFLSGVHAEKEREQWMRRVIRRSSG